MRTLLAAAIVLVAGNSAFADMFSTYNVPDNTTNFGYLNPSLTPALAIDVNGPGETINGVTFTGATFSGTGVGGVSYTLTGTNLTQYPNYTNNDASPQNGSNPVYTLLSNFIYGGATPADEHLTISGLTPHDTMTLTFLNDAFGPGANGGRLADFTSNLPGSNYASTSYNYQENAGGLSVLTYSAFVPNSGSITLSEVPNDGSNGMHIYGFSVTQVVPEPSTMVLAGVAAVGLLAAAVRRRRA